MRQSGNHDQEVNAHDRLVVVLRLLARACALPNKNPGLNSELCANRQASAEQNKSVGAI